MKRIVIFAALAGTFAFALAAQEMSVEDSYLQESVENMIIREQSRSESREMKMLALKYIGEAIERGNTSADVHQALEYLALEGIQNRARENGRLMNNYPDVRRDAVRYLGQLGTPEATETLLKIVYTDNEPMVLQEAVKSLTDIGNGANGRTLETITWIVQKFDNTQPDNLLALSAIEAYEKIGGFKDASAIQMLLRIADGPYIPAVRARAKAALVKIRQDQASAKR
jgi:HEAT repeat protein